MMRSVRLASWSPRSCHGNLVSQPVGLPRTALPTHGGSQYMTCPWPSGFDFRRSFVRLLSAENESNKPEAAVGEEADAKEAVDEKTATTHRGQKEEMHRLLFPWRHEHELWQISPAMELDLNYHKYHGWKVQLFFAFWHRATAYLLGTPWYKLVGQEFKRELEEPAAWAFTRAVGGVLSNVYQVPLEDVYMISMDDEIAEVNFQYTTQFTTTPPSMMNEKERKLKDDATAAAAVNEDQNDPYCTQVREMMDPKLYKLFRKAHAREHGDFHDTKDQCPPPLEILLMMKPIKAELRTMRCFPFISRGVVDEQPTRRKMYFSLLANMQELGFRQFMENFWAFADQMLSERGQLETTAIADFVVHCRETFQVKDLSTNEIIQGDGQGRLVTHVVRMENDVAMVPLNDVLHYVKQGNWKITDIDDMLGGNAWWKD